MTPVMCCIKIQHELNHFHHINKPTVLPSMKHLSHNSDVSINDTPSDGVCEQTLLSVEETVGQLEAIVRANLERSYTLTQLARQAKVTPRELNLAFIQVRGVSVAKWLKEIKLDVARQMLLDECKIRSIKDIASRTGFSSPSSFSHSYFCHFGQLPSETRRAGKGRV